MLAVLLSAVVSIQSTWIYCDPGRVVDPKSYRTPTGLRAEWMARGFGSRAEQLAALERLSAAQQDEAVLVVLPQGAKAPYVVLFRPTPDEYARLVPHLIVVKTFPLGEEATALGALTLSQAFREPAVLVGTRDPNFPLLWVAEIASDDCWPEPRRRAVRP